MLSDGQQQALDELRFIAEAGGSIELIQHRRSRGRLVVELSIDTKFPHEANGIGFRPRERFHVEVSSNYPWQVPSVQVPHRRWALRPHVSFGSYLCLYLAPDVEWDPSDGMYGLVERLVEWLRRAAIDGLDPAAAPLHPPYAPSFGNYLTVVVRDGTPRPTDAPWFGYAPVTVHSNTRVDLRGWLDTDDNAIGCDDDVAAVVLSHRELPYQYPTRLGPFFEALESCGIMKQQLLSLVQAAARHNGDHAPLLVVIGTPMRGTKAGERHQHLAIWHVSDQGTRRLRSAQLEASDAIGTQEHSDELPAALSRWAETARIDWCPVDEARPEVTRPRDGTSPVTEFTGRSVALLGCGAIGSHLAEHLVRVGVTELSLVDHSRVSTGNLTRQTYDERDLTEPKPRALAHRLLRINPQLSLVQCPTDAVVLAGDPSSPIWQHDIIIDATANETVAKRLETVRPTVSTRLWMIRMLLGHHGDRGLLTVAAPDNIGGPPRLARHAKLTATAAMRLKTFADEFWPDPPRGELFLPEPGCSAPTFVGADADVAAIVAALARFAGTALRGRAEGSWTMLELPDATPGGIARSETRDVANPIELEVAGGGFTVQIEHNVMVELLAWIKRCARDFPGDETGGILFGEIDNATRTISVTAAVGPPPDSEASSTGFVCGTSGVDAASDALSELSRGTHRPIGMWHTHPDGSPAASRTDYQGMKTLTGQRDRPLPQQLLLIAGGCPVGSVWNAYLFETRPPNKTTHWPPAKPSPVICDNTAVGRIGLALSGGGLRAAAFHLGCLRALHDRGLLEQVATISGVSGGSLVAALWAYADRSFDDFDATLTAILRRGLWRSIITKWFSPRRLARATVTTLTSGLRNAPDAVFAQGGPRPRTTSSIHAFEAAIASHIVDADITDVAREGLDVIINSCDLRTGSAFRFGNRESGTWRHGIIKHNRVRVAQAAAASAAHPLAFPAYDMMAAFVDRDGREHEQRVILTDGGVYDNLGTSALLPGRSRHISTNVSDPHDWIIACDAGRGLFDGASRPYWYAGRIKQSFDSTYRKAQDSDRSKLFDLNNQQGPVKGFVVAMLGMNDDHLPLPVPNLVPREQVTRFKTDLSALSATEIDLLTLRGQQIMGALVAHYGPRL
ncbi:MAG: patatin-like phospholipase family protein [Acidimicrobiaceae bacterium]|nr:patatin-like phospholipase family protein [Acidimicrobiaceae bacterium]